MRPEPTYGGHKEYFDSGFEWLGTLPCSWALKRIGSVFCERREKVSDRDYPALSVTKGGVVPQLDTAAKTDDGENRKRVCIGDFVINGRSDRKGSAGLSPYSGSVSLINIVMEPTGVSGEFAGYLLKSLPFQEEFYRRGRGIVADLWSTNYGEMKNIYIPIPPSADQDAIVAFLDRETTKIDELIAKQERLIELLAEKRQAVISHAVTKGLDPTVPMKDSGVEWIGEVPAHWTAAPLKYSWKVTDCKHLTAEFVDDGIPLASIREVQDWAVNLTNAKMTSPSYFEQLIEGDRRPCDGDVIFSRNATVGETARVTAQHPAFAMGQDVCLLRKRHSATSTDFLLFTMRSRLVQVQLDSLMIGSTFKRVNVEEIKRIVVTVPPPSEQEEIVHALVVEMARIGTLSNKAKVAIDLMKERRSALISAAVTGKIDVREVA